MKVEGKGEIGLNKSAESARNTESLLTIKYQREGKNWSKRVRNISPSPWSSSSLGFETGIKSRVLFCE